MTSLDTRKSISYFIHLEIFMWLFLFKEITLISKDLSENLVFFFSLQCTSVFPFSSAYPRLGHRGSRASRCSRHPPAQPRFSSFSWGIPRHTQPRWDMLSLQHVYPQYTPGSPPSRDFGGHLQWKGAKEASWLGVQINSTSSFQCEGAVTLFQAYGMYELLIFALTYEIDLHYMSY